MGMRGGGNLLSTPNHYALMDEEEDSLTKPTGKGTTTVVFRVFANRFQSRAHLGPLSHLLDQPREAFPWAVADGFLHAAVLLPAIRSWSLAAGTI
jgi:hypothetical protein